jgi:hypothetical protein
MQGRTSINHSRWLLILLLGGTPFFFSGSAAQSSAVSSSFDVQITLSQKAAAKLESLPEGIVIAAAYSADPVPSAEVHANQNGQIDLGRETVEISGRPQFTHVAGPHFGDTLMAETRGPVQLNVNVYSARRSGPDNILNCGFFDGNLQAAIRKPLAIHCSLISENADPAGGFAVIPPNRAVDSYAIYAMLVPGGPADKIAPVHVQHWTIANTTVGIGQMNPAIPPDGQLKAPPDNVKGFHEALVDFQARKYQRFQLEATSLHMNHPYDMVNEQQISDLRRTGSNSTGIAFFSAVYFSTSQTAALVYVNDWCANLCATGQWVYLEKHGGQWVRRSGIVVPGG